MADPTQTAITAFTELAPDADFPTSPVSVTGTDFDLPDSSTDPLYQNVEKLNLSDLTEGLEGTGSFDKVFASIKEHLEDQFNNNLITGQEYTKAYIELTTAALTTGLEFIVRKDAGFYQNALVQAQARTAQIQSITAIAELEAQKQNALAAAANAQNARAQYALTKQKLATETLVFAKLEKELLLLDEQITAEQKRILTEEKNALRIVAETALTDYRRTDILPEEKRQLAYQTDHVLVKQVAKTDYETTTLLPAQKSNLDKDGSIKDYQLSNTLVQQFKLLQEQTEVQHAQTQDTRIDGLTAITGAVGKQKDLYSQQIDSYKKDARYKVGKMFLDGWITQKSLDEGLLAPDQLSNANVNEVLQGLRSDNLLGS